MTSLLKQLSCLAGALLLGVGHAQFPFPYCTSGPTSALDSNLGAVLLVGDVSWNMSSINSTSNCPGSVGVQNLLSQTAALTVGRNYTLAYTVTTCGGTYTRFSGAWIDFNQNQVFDANETITPNNTMTTNPSQTIYSSFTVPNNTRIGNTRLRVMVQERGTPGMGPCDPFGYGGVKDFSIRVSGNTPPTNTTTFAPTNTTTTLAPTNQSYCFAGPLSTQDSNLGAVRVKGNTMLIDNTANCPGVTGVQDFTYQMADVSRGLSYLLQYEVTTCGGVFTRASGAWIDWNQNMFFDANELLAPTVLTPSNTARQQYVITFNVGLNATRGRTRMRVMVMETDTNSTNSTNGVNPCALFGFGGVKDFSIQVV